MEYTSSSTVSVELEECNMSVEDLRTALVASENALTLDVGTFRKCSNDANIHMYCRLSQAH